MVTTAYSCISAETVARPAMMGRNEVETHTRRGHPQPARSA